MTVGKMSVKKDGASLDVLKGKREKREVSEGDFQRDNACWRKEGDKD